MVALAVAACAACCVVEHPADVAAARRPCHVHGAAAPSAAALRVELAAVRSAVGRLPDAVVGAQLERWMEDGSLDEPWVEALGYGQAQCVYEIDRGGHGIIGEPALMLRPRTLACLSHGDTLDPCVDALNRSGIPVEAWLSQCFYLDVPARRYDEARAVLLRVQERLGRDLGVYPR